MELPEDLTALDHKVLRLAWRAGDPDERKRAAQEFQRRSTAAQATKRLNKFNQLNRTVKRHKSTGKLSLSAADLTPDQRRHLFDSAVQNLADGLVAFREQPVLGEKGKVVSYKRVPDWAARDRARDAVFSLMGSYAPKPGVVRAPEGASPPITLPDWLAQPLPETSLDPDPVATDDDPIEPTPVGELVGEPAPIEPPLEGGELASHARIY